MMISVIMPIYNGQDYLRRAIMSVLNQSYGQLELILINDGSQDGSLKICQAYARQDSRIILIDSENLGPGAARNKGLARASGDYLSFVDADDWLKEDALERLAHLALKDDLDIVACNHFRVDQEITVSKNKYKTGIIKKEDRKNYDFYKTSSSFGYVWGKLYKRSFINRYEIKFSQEKKVFLEDTLFNLKAFAFDPKYYVVNRPLYYYHISPDSVSNREEDLTDRAMGLLESYQDFLDGHDLYDENLDLFVSLGGRVIAWSLMRTLNLKARPKDLYDRVLSFSACGPVQRLFSHPDLFNQVRKIPSLSQRLLYGLIIVTMRFKFERLLTGFFYLNKPLFNLYIKYSLKT